MWVARRVGWLALRESHSSRLALSALPAHRTDGQHGGGGHPLVIPTAAAAFCVCSTASAHTRNAPWCCHGVLHIRQSSALKTLSPPFSFSVQVDFASSSSSPSPVRPSYKGPSHGDAPRTVWQVCAAMRCSAHSTSRVYADMPTGTHVHRHSFASADSETPLCAVSGAAARCAPSRRRRTARANTRAQHLARAIQARTHHSRDTRKKEMVSGHEKLSLPPSRLRSSSSTHASPSHDTPRHSGDKT